MQTSLESAAYEESIFDEEQKPVVYAGFWKRFAALLLDGLVMLPLSIITLNSRTAWYGAAVMAMTGLAGIIYKPLLEYLYGATLGKKAMSIVVTNNLYEKPNLREALLRNIFGIVSNIISLGFSLFVFANGQLVLARSGFSVFQGMLGYSLAVGSISCLIGITDFIVFLADKRNRALHDFIGKTYVIKQ
jgi:uncharacterized RDD family membrane protein YckC